MTQQPSTPSTELLFEGDPPPKPARVANGVLPSQELRRLITKGHIKAAVAIPSSQVQPASLDLRLGRYAYRVPCSFLPGPDQLVMDRVRELAMEKLDLSETGFLAATGIYIIPLCEELDLPADVSGTASPKSSTGRLDVFTRLIVDRSTKFEAVPDGYRGRMYLEVSPRSFHIKAHQGDSLNQLRLRRGRPRVTASELAREHGQSPIVHDGSADGRERLISGSVWLSVDLRGTSPSAPVAFRAKRDPGATVDLRRVGAHDAQDYWDPIFPQSSSGLMLQPGEFYILATQERVRIPQQWSAEMAPYDTTFGEFRVHYAGFFDPGFGGIDARNQGTPAVLEVRSHETPFLLEHGQWVARLEYERLAAEPDVMYGSGIGSHYSRQGLTLAKHFDQRMYW